MRSMRLSFRVPATDDGLLAEGVQSTPELDRQLVLGGQRYGDVETLATYVEGDPAAYEASLDADPAVLEYELTAREDGCVAYLRRELGEEGRSVADAFEQESIVMVPPVEFRSDGTVIVTLVGRSGDLDEVVEQLQAEVEPTVRQLAEGVVPAGVPLSERQREALRAAQHVGYYEVPRREGIEAVADELDCAVSTASELVRRGEAALVRRTLGPST